MQGSMPTIEPTNKAENVLGILGRKMSSGRELSLAENLMAMTATSAVTADRYGPGPEAMQLNKPELPEVVKGVLANYSGI